MTLDPIIVGVTAAFVSGLGTALINSYRESKKEKTRKNEREQDRLKMDLKDLKIELYKLEKELTEWKDKYYTAISELIEIKAELERALIAINHAEIDCEVTRE